MTKRSKRRQEQTTKTKSVQSARNAKAINKKMMDDFRVVEATKLLRTNIEFSGDDKKVILFTSCTPGEGKSTISYAIAKSFAENEETVLYIDADLRRSVFTGVHGTVGKSKGLSHYLSGKAEIGEIIGKVQKSKTMAIMSGVIPPNPSELLGNGRFGKLIETASKSFDRIIIDTPPLGRVIDAAIIAKKCDGAILIIAANEIKYKHARAVKEQLELSGCPIIGAVLNKTDTKLSGYYGEYQ
ncbi:MAG: CpsD/CapB family tyrosine-protein kinase [Suipraeoptans sp.]